MKARPTSAWLKEFKSTLSDFTDRGDYAGAMPHAKSALKTYPSDFFVRFSYAKILGDWADELPPAKKKKLKRESIQILKPLLRAMSSQPVDVRFRVSLNYYYQSEDWAGMYAFGRRFVRHSRRDALYAQGLAATSIAFDLHSAGQKTRAVAWARKANAAWEKYGFKKETYYFPIYNYAKSLALEGRTREAMVALKTAAKLGRRPVTDWEFADALKLIETT